MTDFNIPHRTDMTQTLCHMKRKTYCNGRSRDVPSPKLTDSSIQLRTPFSRAARNSRSMSWSKKWTSKSVEIQSNELKECSTPSPVGCLPSSTPVTHPTCDRVSSNDIDEFGQIPSSSLTNQHAFTPENYSLSLITCPTMNKNHIKNNYTHNEDKLFKLCCRQNKLVPQSIKSSFGWLLKFLNSSLLSGLGRNRHEISKISSNMAVLLIVMLVIFSNVLQTAASRAPKQCLDLKTPGPKKYLFDKNNQVLLPLNLATSDRLTHRLATAIFKIFLYEKVGYQNVQIIQYQTNLVGGSAFDWLQAPDHDDSKRGMINLEVWDPSPNAPEKDAVNCGSLGSGGRFGWYVTNYTQPSPRTSIIDHWRAFRSKDTARLFALTDEEDLRLRTNYTHLRGRYFCEHPDCVEGVYTPPQCQGNPNCATLFVGDYASSAFLANQTKLQNLLVRVMWIGPNLTPTFIEEFRPKDKGVMFFSWWPNTLSTLPDILPVAFPPCTRYDDPDPSENFFCRYELHILEKHVWQRVHDSAMTAFQAVERFYLNGRHYRQLLEEYRKKTRSLFTLEPVTSMSDRRDDHIIDEIACDWLKNESLDNWTPMFYNLKPMLWIGGIFPVSGEGPYMSKELIRAAEMAEDRIENNPNVLNNFKLALKLQDGECDRDSVLSVFISYVVKGSDDYTLDFNQMVGILGPSCSDTVEPLAGVANHFNTVIISYSAEGAIFSDDVNSNKYPYFFRTIPENLNYKHVYKYLFTTYKWKHVASLSRSGNKYSEYLTSLVDTLQPYGIRLDNQKFQGENKDMSKPLQRLRDHNHRIIIGDFYDDTARAVMCEAYHQNMTARHGYVWFIPRWLPHNWWNMTINFKPDGENPGMNCSTNGNSESDQHNIRMSPNDTLMSSSTVCDIVKPPCTTSQILQALDGHLSLGYTYFAPDDTLTHENITVGEWKELLRKKTKSSYLPDYAGYTYDAMWTFALALDQLLDENLTHYADLHSDATNSRFVEILKGTNFTGVSGQLSFSATSRKTSSVNVYQFTTDPSKIAKGTVGGYIKVGYFDPERDEQNLNTPNRIVWLNEGGTVPLDGSQTCYISFLSEALNVSCEAAIILAMFVGFLLLFTILLPVCAMYKRRLERMRPPMYWPQMEECEVPRSRIVMNRTIGQGQFGTVYGGEFEGKDGAWVAAAIKTLKVGSTDDNKLDFLQEAKMMKQLDHPNIIKLLALCLTQEPILMVMEFMLHGDLKVYLLARRHLVAKRNPQDDNHEMSSRRLTRMALDVACALAYLAEKKYVHRDIACRNCLVNADLVVKLGDFGMAREIFNSEYYKFSRKGMLPVRWMAPESLDDGKFTTASDMWSYGVLLYEIITFANFPFFDLSSQEVVEYVKKGNTICIPAGVKPQIRELLLRCWQYYPSRRPTFAQMVEHLTNNPRLLAPCLDMPSASVEINEEDSILPKISSGTHRHLNRTGQRNTSPVDSQPSSQSGMYNTSPSGGGGVPDWGLHDPLKPGQHQHATYRTPTSLENGNGPVLEPLLPISNDSYITR